MVPNSAQGAIARGDILQVLETPNGIELTARLLARHPRLRLVVAHLGMPEYAEFLTLAERYPGVLLDTTMAFTPFIDEAGAPFPAGELPRLRDLGDRVLLETTGGDRNHYGLDLLWGKRW